MPSQVTCAVCGTEFTAARSTAKYCSSTCRTRARRRAAQPATDTPATDDQAVDFGRGVLEQTRLDLVAMGKLHTGYGQQAIALATRLSATSADSGSAIAALSRELTRLMEALRVGARVVEDEVEKARRRRDEKLAHARSSST